MNPEKRLAAVLKALGDVTRLRILKLLAGHSGPLCVGALARKLKISQPAVSQHLRVLKTLNIVDGTRMGVRVHYRINESRLVSYRTQIDKFLEGVRTPRTKSTDAGCGGADTPQPRQ